MRYKGGVEERRDYIAFSETYCSVFQFFTSINCFGALLRKVFVHFWLRSIHWPSLRSIKPR
jgi:hypothetical protein